MATTRRYTVFIILFPVLALAAIAARPHRLVPTEIHRLPGLAGPVEIWVDPWGIAHIYATTFDDLFFAQGYNAARDRLWQIDLWRRRGLGRLAAVLGPEYVAYDRAARLFLYRGDMAAEWRAYGPDALRMVAAFVRGVNAYIREIRKHPALMPPEFRWLGYQPEEWQPEDIVRIRIHGLWRNVRSEVIRARVVCRFGWTVEAVRRRLEPAWRPRVPDGLDPCVIPDDVLQVYNRATGDLRFRARPERRLKPLSLGPQPPFADAPARLVPVATDDDGNPAFAPGSNNWVVAPRRSRTGRPILANDPHRAVRVPSLRYAVHLVAPDLDIIGAGEPFLPGISIGHNGRVAFGLTVFPIDQEDLYVYETHPDDPHRYRYRGRWEAMKIFTETLSVRGAPSREIALKYTRHGPVIYEDPEHHRAFALRAAWLEPGMAPYYGSVAYLRAADARAFREALRHWGGPSENQVFADIHGNIGWQPAGRAPLRPNWDGLLPVPGDGRYEWVRYLDLDELPGAVNPERGWIATANQMNLPPDYPYARRKLGFEWAYPWRFRRIAEVLQQSPKFGIPESLRLQTDYLSIPARRLIRLLRDLETDDPIVARARDLLVRWDARLGPESAAAALFEVWYRRYLTPAVVERLVPREAQSLVRSGDARVVLNLLEHPDTRLGASPRSARDDILRRTLSGAWRELEKLLGPDPGDWAWGRLHHAMFVHPLADVAPKSMRGLMITGPLPRGGSSDTVNSTAYRLTDFRQIGGATWRMVLDVGNWDHSWAMNAPGQAGDPRMPHFMDLARRWARDRAFPLLYSRDRIEAVAEVRIRLLPAR